MVGNSTKAQMALLALASVFVIVIIIIYMMSTRESAETEAKRTVSEAEAMKNIAIKIEDSCKKYLRESLYETVYEMGQHGGFTQENLPSPSYAGVPFWFKEGVLLNIPTKEVMRDMLAARIIKRMEGKLKELEEILNNPDIKIGLPSIESVELQQMQILAKIKIPYEIVISDTSVKNDIVIEEKINSRLAVLRDLAEIYINNYKSRRSVEEIFMESIRNDDRIPDYGSKPGPMKPCYENKVFKTYKEIIGPVRENANLAIAKELQNMRRLMVDDATLVDIFPEGEERELIKKYIDWTVSFNIHSVKFSFMANKDAPTSPPRSDSAIYLINQPIVGFVDVTAGNCLSYYTVDYTARFPFKIVIKDLMKNMKIVGVGGASSEEMRPLEFIIAVEPYIYENNPHAVNETFKNRVKERISNMCEGSCRLDIRFSGPAEAQNGIFSLGSCSVEVRGGRFINTDVFNVDRVACGRHTITYRPESPKYAKYSEVVVIEDVLEKTIELKEWSRLYGSVRMIDRVYCTKSKSVPDNPQLKLLTHIDGQPPRTIYIAIKSLNPDLETPVKVHIDENGRYSFEKISAGKYLLIAYPSEDSKNTPTYKLQPYGAVIDILPGDNEYNINMEPLFVELVDNRYIYVSRRDNC